MEPSLIIKALSNETRRQILTWLKHPERHFDETPYVQHGVPQRIGACVSDIQEKAGLAQSVISSYLPHDAKRRIARNGAGRQVDLLPPQRKDHSGFCRLYPE